MRPVIFPYKMGSRSARALSRLMKDLRCKQIKPDGRYKYWNNHLIINWGNSLLPRWHERRVKYVNHPDSVSVASHKLLCLQKLYEESIPIPSFTTNQEEAKIWLADGGVIYARTYLRGSGGRGISVLDNNSSFIRAPLYTLNIHSRGEYRVHVFNNNIIDYQKKRRDSTALDNNNVDERIRNHNNGWIFCRDNLKHIEENEDIAKKAIQALGLTFGAVDIIRGEDKHSYVLEVNTAPGLEGTTLDIYHNKLREYVNEYRNY